MKYLNLIFIIWSISFSAMGIEKVMVNIGESSYPPYIIHDGKRLGIMIDIIKIATKNLGKEI